MTSFEKRNHSLRSFGKMSISLGIVIALLALLRFIQLLLIPDGYTLYPECPLWVIQFLKIMTFSLFIVGTAILISGLIFFRKEIIPPYVLIFSQCLSITLLIWISMYGYYQLNESIAVAEGGSLWGLIYTCTIITVYSPNGATAAGLVGYRIGQLLALIIMASIPIILLRLQYLNTKQKCKEELVNAGNITISSGDKEAR